MAITCCFVQKARRKKPQPPRAKNKETRAIEAMHRATENAVAVHLFDGVQRLRQGIQLPELVDAIASGKAERVLTTLNYRGFDKQVDKVTAKLGGLGPKTREEVTRGIKGGLTGPGTRDKKLTEVINFRDGQGRQGDKRNAVHRAARRAATREQVTTNRVEARMRSYMRDLVEPKKAAIAETIRTSLKAGLVPKDIAPLIKDQIGLTRRQQRAVERKYLKELKDTKNPISETQAKANSATYSQDLLRYRTETIAVTETRTLGETIKNDTWMQLKNDDLLGKNPMITWLLGELDEKTCELCKAIANTSVPLGELFVLDDGNECLPGFAHPRCRCHSMLTTDDDKGDEAYVSDEDGEADEAAARA